MHPVFALPGKNALDHLNAGLRASYQVKMPVLTEVIVQGVLEGVFDTFDPEGVGDMIQGFAASTRKNLVDVLNAPDAKSRRKAIDVSVTRLKLYGVATDRIVGLPDGSTVVLDRKQVEAIVALL